MASPVLLDTNVFIDELVPDDRPTLISTVTLAELSHGVAAAEGRDPRVAWDREQRVRRIRVAYAGGIPFTHDLLPAYQAIARETLRRGGNPRAADTFIAATALHLGVPVMTSDRGFPRLDNVLEIIRVGPPAR